MELTKPEVKLLEAVRGVDFGDILIVKNNNGIVSVRVSKTLDPKEFREEK
jgi:hypothetical protein